MKAPLDEMPARLAALLDERKKLERELSDARRKLAMGGGAKAGAEANGVRMIGDVKLMARAVEGIDIKDLKSLADEGKKQLGSGVVALVGGHRGRQSQPRRWSHERFDISFQCRRPRA